MGFLDSLFKKGANEEVIGSPVTGKCVPLKTVNDPTFADEILGKGVAVVPTEGKFYAPADGTVNTVFPTGHAVAMTTDRGTELLIHVGLDTVNLQGEHYTKHVEDGAKVKKGDLLLEADLEQIRAAGYDTITPVIVCNSDAFKSMNMEAEKEVTVGDTLMKLSK